MSKRSRFELFGDILVAIREDISRNGNARLTRVHSKVNVPYDRFKGYVESLKRVGLIEIEEENGIQEMRLTSRALVYLGEYARVKTFMVAFGLENVSEGSSQMGEPK